MPVVWHTGLQPIIHVTHLMGEFGAIEIKLCLHYLSPWTSQKVIKQMPPAILCLHKQARQSLLSIVMKVPKDLFLPSMLKEN